MVSSNEHILSSSTRVVFWSRRGHALIYVRSIDTDVQVLALFHQQSIQARILLVTGTRKRQHIVDIQSLAARLGTEVCNAIKGMHAFTGCDYQCIDGNFNVTADLHELCEKFAMRLYSADAPTINEQRYILFCTRSLPLQQLAPTRDAPRKHVARANYQTAIWKLALEAQPHIPSHDGHGWSVVDVTVNILWKDNGAAPHALLSLTKCGCKIPCATNRCSCRASNTSCTVACR